MFYLKALPNFILVSHFPIFLKPYRFRPKKKTGDFDRQSSFFIYYGLSICRQSWMEQALWSEQLPKPERQAIQQPRHKQRTKRRRSLWSIEQ